MTASGTATGGARTAETQGSGDGESAVTVVVAGIANLLIAVAKAIGAVVSGSAAMFSEAAHSVADTVTEVLLFVALRRGARPADERHPLGHGRESYLWALLAALATFAAGAAVSIAEGIDKILHGEEAGDPLVSYVVLAAAFVIEGASLLRALSQLRSSGRRWRMRARDFLRETTDTTVKAVTFEDSAALVGIALAAAGLALTEATGNAAWDGYASVAIGLVLVAVAGTLMKVNLGLLIGRSAPAVVVDGVREELDRLPGVRSLSRLLVTVTGPQQYVVAAKVEFADGITTDDVERVADEADRVLTARFSGIQEVFLDPTARHQG